MFERWLVVVASMISAAVTARAQPVVTRLVPPSKVFADQKQEGPIVARFLPGQRFDLQVTVDAGAASRLDRVEFLVDGVSVGVVTTFAGATATPSPTDWVATRRAFSCEEPGEHRITVKATDAAGAVATAHGNFEVVKIRSHERKARNLIIMIGDGMGMAHRTAARIMKQGVSFGKSDGLLEMDKLGHTALVTTHSLNSIVTDSSPGAAAYSTGNKSNNQQHGVFPDDTLAAFDNPRVENVAEFLSRTQGKVLGLVTTADVADATPAAFASHTQNRAAGTGVCDQFFDERQSHGLHVLMGGGRKWFLPQDVPGSTRATSNDGDYQLPADLADAWKVPSGRVDPDRDLLAEFEAAGFAYAGDRAGLVAVPAGSRRILGLFNFSNMNVSLDKIAGRRGHDGLVHDYGFPDQPMLEEMTQRALDALALNEKGFVLMVEGASIDKQSHNMDSDRWIHDAIEFDHAVGVCRRFLEAHPDTLLIVTADHECGGANIIGGSMVTQEQLKTRGESGGGAAQVRDGVVGTNDDARFPRYVMAPDGYPTTTDIDYRMLIGYAANADRYEDWRTNPRPIRDPQQPFNDLKPLNTYPTNPMQRDLKGGFMVTGQIQDTVASHTATDVPLTADGCGASRFRGVIDNTEVFFRAMQAVLGGAPVED